MRPDRAAIARASSASHGRWPDISVFVGAITIFCLLAASRGPDANWDLLNYHLYNPFALLNKPFGYDLAPAQLQTFLNPALDLPNYFLRVQLNNWPRLLNAILALPQAIAAFLAFRVALQIIPQQTPSRTILALIAVVFGATGVAALPSLGTSQSEMIPACCLIGSLLIVLRSIPMPRFFHLRMTAAGLLAGLAFGLKLTLAPYCLGLGVAVALTCGPLWRPRFTSVVAFGLGACIGALLTGGAWWFKLYEVYGNPVFPYFNNLFQSPYYEAAPLTDERFKPSGLIQAIFYPFFWAFRRQTLIAELTFRDPRVAFAYVAAFVSAAGGLFAAFRRPPACRWLDARSWCVLIFISLGFAVWEAQFSILRYLAPLELLIGMPLLLAIRPLLAVQRGVYLPHVLLAGVTAICLSITVYPEWGHAVRGPVAARVVLPELAPNSLVILLDSSPMSFIAAYAPTNVRFIGANSNLIRPGLKVRLQDQIEATIRSHDGPLWGLEEDSRTADRTLAYYNLHREPGCMPVVSNLNNNATKICRLSRDGR